MVIVFALTAVTAGALLFLSLWPGVLGGLVFGFPDFVLYLPLLAAWTLTVVAVGLSDLRRRPERRRWGLLAAAVWAGTALLLWGQIPRRVGLAVSLPSFTELADGPPAEAVPLGRRLGLYRVEWYGPDRRGGVYFRTRYGPNGIGPDGMSYGFAFRPNAEGTPFGNAYYGCQHLFGDWYWFWASDDW